MKRGSADKRGMRSPKPAARGFASALSLAACFVPLLAVLHAAWWHEEVQPDELGAQVLLAPTLPFLTAAMVVAIAAGLAVVARGTRWGLPAWTRVVTGLMTLSSVWLVVSGARGGPFWYVWWFVSL